MCTVGANLSHRLKNRVILRSRSRKSIVMLFNLDKRTNTGHHMIVMECFKCQLTSLPLSECELIIQKKCFWNFFFTNFKATIRRNLDCINIRSRLIPNKSGLSQSNKRRKRQLRKHWMSNKHCEECSLESTQEKTARIWTNFLLWGEETQTIFQIWNLLSDLQMFGRI